MQLKLARCGPGPPGPACSRRAQALAAILDPPQDTPAHRDHIAGDPANHQARLPSRLSTAPGRPVRTG